jgi:hypothetical protein
MARDGGVRQAERRLAADRHDASPRLKGAAYARPIGTLRMRKKWRAFLRVGNNSLMAVSLTH